MSTRCGWSFAHENFRPVEKLPAPWVRAATGETTGLREMVTIAETAVTPARVRPAVRGLRPVQRPRWRTPEARGPLGSEGRELRRPWSRGLVAIAGPAARWAQPVSPGWPPVRRSVRKQ